MGRVGAGFSMSLDGFIAGPNDDVHRLFQWYSLGDANVEITSGNRTFKMSSDAAEQMAEMSHAVGAIVSGRRMFDVAQAWGGKHPMDVPVVVLTHTAPEAWIGKESPFTFVTDGIARAVAQAQAIAGDKMVGVGGADITRQCLRAGLLDEIAIDLIPVLLGSGVRLFEYLGIEPIELEIAQVNATAHVIHLRYRVIK